MITSKLVRMMAVGSVAALAYASQAFALEGNSPYQPGVSIGIPTGALPPPGLYFSDDNVVILGPLKNSAGKSIGANVFQYVNAPAVLWSPTWQPLSFMNATMAFDAVEPFVNQSFGPVGKTQTGFFNSIIGANVSWNFAPIFVKVGFAVYINDGDWTGGIANNTWTFSPDVAVSWLSNGWDITGHLVADYQTEDTHAHYQSGDNYYLDLTVGKSFGKLTVGGGANWTQQFNNDKLTSAALCGGPSSCDTPGVPGGQGKGNRQYRVLAGPFMGYNFGPVELNAKALWGVDAVNTFNVSFYHVGFSFPF
jgi:hypothetical protein